MGYGVVEMHYPIDAKTQKPVIPNVENVVKEETPKTEEKKEELNKTKKKR